MLSVAVRISEFFVTSMLLQLSHGLVNTALFTTTAAVKNATDDFTTTPKYLQYIGLMYFTTTLKFIQEDSCLVPNIDVL